MYLETSAFSFNEQLEVLAKRFDETFASIPPNKLRYCNPKSVQNFLLHLPKIKGRSEKQEIIDKLSFYCTILEHQYPEELNARVAKHFFQDHLLAISNTFDWRLGFTLFFQSM